jgi:hypothetical protein
MMHEPEIEAVMIGTESGQGEVPANQPLVACPQCGALNKVGASYCIGCGSFLPPPVGHPSYAPAMPLPAERTGLSVPMILLIIALALAVIIPLLLLIFLVAI